MPTTKNTMEFDRESILKRIAELKRDQPPGWKRQGRALCNALGDAEQLLHPQRPATRSPAQHDGTQLAFEDDGCLTQAVAPASHDEFAEVIEIVRAWPGEDRLRLFDELGLKVAGEAPGTAQRAFEQGREVGMTEGMRKLLEKLFLGAATTKGIGERACVIAAAWAYPDAPAKSIREVAAMTGLGDTTAKRRIDDARPAVQDMPKWHILSPDFIGSN
jgi:hypothetical protein